MSNIPKVGFALMKIAKTGNTRAFLEFVERNRVLTNLQTLSAIDTSQLIYSFSKLKIEDRRIWTGLENTFLNKQNKMNLHDMIMCAGAFGRYTKNPKVWTAIETYLVLNQDQIEMRSIVTLAHAFAHANYQSATLWALLEKLSINNLYRCIEKELAIMTWGFSHMEKGSPEFWNKLGDAISAKVQTYSLQNLAIIAYGFSRLRKGNETFWRAVERSATAALNARSDRLKVQDLGNLAWAFANLGLGSKNYWESLERLTVKNMHRYKMIDFANQSWSFLYSHYEGREFWESMVNQLNKMPSFDDMSYARDLVLIGAALAQKDIKDRNLWMKILHPFIKMLKSGALNGQMGRARFHKAFFEWKPSLWDEEVESIYLKVLDESRDNVPVLIQNLMNICTAAYPSLGSHNFWMKTFDLFIDAMAHPATLTDNQEIKSRVAHLIYIFETNFVFAKNQDMLTKLDKALDDFYQDENVFLKMTLGNKLTFLVQLKAFVLRKVFFHNRKFWHYMVIHKEKFASQFDINDIRNLMFTIIIKNGLYFVSSKYDEYNRTVNQLYGNCSKEDIREMTDYLFEMLLTKHKSHEQVWTDFKGNPQLAKLNLENFLSSKSNKEENENETEIHREYRAMSKEYENKQAPEGQAAYIEEDEH